MRTIHKIAVITIATLPLVFLSGCHTVGGTLNGAGQDVQTVGTAFTPSQPSTTRGYTTTYSTYNNPNAYRTYNTTYGGTRTYGNYTTRTQTAYTPTPTPTY